VVHVSLLRPYHGDDPSGHFKPLPASFGDTLAEQQTNLPDQLLDSPPHILLDEITDGNDM